MRGFLVKLFIFLAKIGLRDLILRYIAFKPPNRPTYSFRKSFMTSSMIGSVKSSSESCIIIF